MIRKTARRAETLLSVFFDKQIPRVADQIAKAIGIKKGDSDTDNRANEIVGNLALDWSALIQPMAKIIMVVSTDGGTKGLNQIGVTEEGIATEVHQRAVDYANGRAAEMVGKKWVKGELVDNLRAQWRIDDATRLFVKDSVLKALTEGLSWTELRDELASGYAFGKARAAMIARTELAKADVSGNMAAYRASGIVTKKQWLTADDDKVSEECEANAEQGEIDLDDDFQSGADAPPEHPNCRCDVIPIQDKKL